MKHIRILSVLAKHDILTYSIYVDDILIIYKDTTNIKHILSEFNALHPNIHFTMEMEMDKQLNFLDISTYRTQRDLQFGIYRKPTVTDIMIHNKSCHPREHKWSGIEYLINRLQKYPIVGKQDEQEVIKHLLTANGYSHDILEYRLQRQKWEKIEKEVLKKPTNKWVTFTNTGKEIRYITKLFKN
jgi:hypothetical protein